MQPFSVKLPKLQTPPPSDPAPPTAPSASPKIPLAPAAPFVGWPLHTVRLEIVTFAPGLLIWRTRLLLFPLRMRLVAPEAGDGEVVGDQ